MEKACNRCGQTKPLEEFSIKSARQPYDSRCKECKKELSRQYYVDNRERVKQKQKRHYQQLAARIEDIKKDLRCIRCGESHPATLDFHHRDPEEKENSIANLSKLVDLDRLYIEMAKCDVLCSNCHRKLHYEEKRMS